MKKRAINILSLLMVCLLLLGTAACGSTAPEPPPTPEPVQETEPPPTPEPAEIPAEVTGSPVRGKWNGNVYSSAYLGFRFVLQDGWAVASEAEIATLMELGEEILNEISENELSIPSEFWDMADITVFHELMASNIDTGASVQIIFERLLFPNTGISAPDYIKIAAPFLEEFGFTVDLSNTDTVKIGENSWYLLAAEVNYGEIPLYQNMYINIYEGIARMVTISFHDNSESVEDILSMFIGMDDPIPDTQSRTFEVDDELVGTWAWDDDDSYTYTFHSDGTLVRGVAEEYEEHEWGTDGGEHLIIGSGPRSESWTYTISENVLTIESRQQEGVIFSYNWVSD